MMGCSSWATKRFALAWRLCVGLLATLATILIAIPGADAARADRAPTVTVQTAAPPVQSCNDAYDQTGVGGAGVWHISAIGNGIYDFAIKFNPDFIAAHPPSTDFVWAEARIFVDGNYAFSIQTGHARPLTDAFHSNIKLQGYRYGRRNRETIQRGNSLTFRISLLLIDPVSWTFYPGHGTISCRL